jgi:hypothetical protein
LANSHRSISTGGDKLLKDQIFIPNTADPLKQAAGVRDGGVLACLVGIAARKSIASKEPVMVKDLTTFQLLEKKSTKN